jgi:N6-L-threonylcarbamoyladenine synthase
MIALAAGMRWRAGLVPTGDAGYRFDVKPRWPLAELDLA